MPRKEDKKRPYRVDYIRRNEVKGRKAFVHSVIIRTTTAVDAKLLLIAEAKLYENDDIEIIRSRRYYKKLGKTPVEASLSRLFGPKRTASILRDIERDKNRASATPGYDSLDDDKSQAGTTVTADEISGKNALEKALKDYRKQYEAGLTVGGPSPTSDVAEYHTTQKPPVTLPEHSGAVLKQTFSFSAPQPDTVRGLGFPDHPVVPTKDAVFDHQIDLDKAAPILHPAPEEPKVIDPGPNCWSGGLKIPMPTGAAVPPVDPTTLPPSHPDHVCSDACYDIVPLDDKLLEIPPDIQNIVTTPFPVGMPTEVKVERQPYRPPFLVVIIGILLFIFAMCELLSFLSHH
jgi:hypothetical protein